MKSLRWGAAAAAALIVLTAWAFAQSAQAPPAGANEPKEPPPIGPPSSYAVGEKPPPVEKVYENRRSKVWKKIVEQIQEAGVEIETTDPETGYLKTKLMPFDGKRFLNVATPPPAISKARPIRQWFRLNRGQFSIDVAVREVKEGTAVTVQAYIEEAAVELTTDRRLWVERYSNGTIEKYFFERFDKALK